MFKIIVKCIIIINGDNMQEIINSFVNNIVTYLQTFGIPFGCFIVILESIIPARPLGVFIAFNMMAFGNVVGFLISWLSTSLGCTLSYFFFKNFVGKKMEKVIKKYPKVGKSLKAVKKISFSNLVLIIALPFSQAFLINIACGLSKTDFKKFITAILIGKLSIIYFWGFVSKSLLESITDIKTLIIIGILLIVSYALSKIVNKKLKFE